MSSWHNVAGHSVGGHLRVQCAEAWCGQKPPDLDLPLAPAADEAGIRADERRKIAAMLRRAAAGRLEYAGQSPDAHPAREPLVGSARQYESAAVLVEDPRAILSVVPSWRWTPEERAWLDSQETEREGTT